MQYYLGTVIKGFGFEFSLHMITLVEVFFKLQQENRHDLHLQSNVNVSDRIKGEKVREDKYVPRQVQASVSAGATRAN